MTHDISFKKSILFLMIAIFVQSFHMLEHIFQIVQKFALQLSTSRGLVGESLDVEPVHFAYNLAYLGLVTMVWFSVRKTESRLICALSTFAVGFQGWHFVEHVIKLEQHFTEGCLSCLGILGPFVDIVILHFMYSLVSFVPLILILILITKDIEK